MNKKFLFLVLLLMLITSSFTIPLAYALEYGHGKAFTSSNLAEENAMYIIAFNPPKERRLYVTGIKITFPSGFDISHADTNMVFGLPTRGATVTYDPADNSILYDFGRRYRLRYGRLAMMFISNVTNPSDQGSFHVDVQLIKYGGGTYDITEDGLVFIRYVNGSMIQDQSITGEEISHASDVIVQSLTVNGPLNLNDLTVAGTSWLNGDVHLGSSGHIYFDGLVGSDILPGSTHAIGSQVSEWAQIWAEEGHFSANLTTPHLYSQADMDIDAAGELTMASDNTTITSTLEDLSLISGNAGIRLASGMGNLAYFSDGGIDLYEELDMNGNAITDSTGDLLLNSASGTVHLLSPILQVGSSIILDSNQNGIYSTNAAEFSISPAAGQNLHLQGSSDVLLNATNDISSLFGGSYLVYGPDVNFDLTGEFMVNAPGRIELDSGTGVTGIYSDNLVDIDAGQVSVNGATVTMTATDVSLDTTTFTLTSGTGSLNTDAWWINDSGSAQLAGDLTVNGTTTLGNEAGDEVVFVAGIASDVLPTGSRDMGSTPQEWVHVYAKYGNFSHAVKVGSSVYITTDKVYSGPSTQLKLESGNGPVSIADDLSVSGNLNVSDTTNLTGALTANGGASISGGLTSLGTFQVGPAMFTVDAAGNMMVKGTSTMGGPAILQDTLHVTGLTTFDNGFVVNVNQFTVDAAGNVHAEGTMRVDKFIYANGGITTTGGDLFLGSATDTSHVNGTLIVSGNLNVEDVARFLLQVNADGGITTTAGDLELSASSGTVHVADTLKVGSSVFVNGSSIEASGGLTIATKNGDLVLRPDDANPSKVVMQVYNGANYVDVLTLFPGLPHEVGLGADMNMNGYDIKNVGAVTMSFVNVDDIYERTAGHEVVIHDDLLPSSNALTLGDPAHRWGSLYLDSTINSLNSLTIQTVSGNIALNAAGDVQVEGVTFSGSDILNINDIGSAGSRISTLYAASVDTADLKVGANGATFSGDLDMQDNDIDNVGNLDVNGIADIEGATDIASTLDVHGNVALYSALTVGGLTSLNGNVDIGDSSSDTVTFNALTDSDILPSSSNLYNLGYASNVWNSTWARYGNFTSQIKVGSSVLITTNTISASSGLNMRSAGSMAISSTGGTVTVEDVIFSGDDVSGIDELTASTVYAGVVNPAGTDILVGGNLIPSSSSYTLGNSTHRWSALYLNSMIDSLNSLTVRTSGNNDLYVDVGTGNVVFTASALTSSSGDLVLNAPAGQVISVMKDLNMQNNDINSVDTLTAQDAYIGSTMHLYTFGAMDHIDSTKAIYMAPTGDFTLDVPTGQTLHFQVNSLNIAEISNLGLKMYQDIDMQNNDLNNARDVNVNRDLSVGNNANIGVNLGVVGNSALQGSLTVNGNVTLGDDVNRDWVVFNSKAASNILPNATQTFNLGSSSHQWNSTWARYGNFTSQIKVGSSVLITTNTISASSGLNMRSAGSMAISSTGGSVTVEDVVISTNTISTSSGNLVLDSITGTTQVNDDLDLNGNADISGTLDVHGATHLYSTLTVDGTSTFNDDVTLSGANLSVGGTLSVSGLSSLNGGINVNSGKFTVDTSGNVHADGNLDVDGTLTVGTGTMTVQSTSTASSMEASSPLTISTSTGSGANIEIDSDGGTTTVDDDLVVKGSSSLGDNSGDTISLGGGTGDLVNFNGYLGTSIIPNSDNSVDLGSASKRFRSGYFGTQVKVGSSVTVTTGSLAATGGLTLTSGTGALTLDSGTNTIYFSGDSLSSINNVNVGGSVTVTNALSVTAVTSTTTLGGTLTVNGGTTLNGGLTVTTGGATISGGLTVSSGGATINGGLSTDTLTASSTITASGAIKANGGITTDSGFLLLDSAGGTVQVSDQLIPSTGSTYNLGSSSNTWANLYVDTVSVTTITAGTLHVGTIDNNGNPVQFGDDIDVNGHKIKDGTDNSVEFGSSIYIDYGNNKIYSDDTTSAFMVASATNQDLTVSAPGTGKVNIEGISVSSTTLDLTTSGTLQFGSGNTLTWSTANSRFEFNQDVHAPRLIAGSTITIDSGSIVGSTALSVQSAADQNLVLNAPVSTGTPNVDIQVGGTSVLTVSSSSVTLAQSLSGTSASFGGGLSVTGGISTDTLSVSSTSTFNDDVTLSGANLSVGGNLAVGGDASFGTADAVQDTISLGAESADRISINGLVNTNVLPTGTVSLGGPSNRWSALYLASTIDASGALTIQTSTANDITISANGGSNNVVVNANNWSVDSSGSATIGNGLTVSAGTVSLPANQIDDTELAPNAIPSAYSTTGSISLSLSRQSDVVVIVTIHVQNDATGDTGASELTVSLSGGTNSGISPSSHGFGDLAASAYGSRTFVFYVSSETSNSPTYSVSISGLDTGETITYFIVAYALPA